MANSLKLKLQKEFYHEQQFFYRFLQLLDLPPKRAIEYGLLNVHLYSTWISATKNNGVKDDQVTLNEEEHMRSNQDSRAPIGRQNQIYRAKQCKLSYY